MNLYSPFSQKDILILIQLVEKRYHSASALPGIVGVYGTRTNLITFDDPISFGMTHVFTLGGRSLSG
jgi:hypothetical protein